VSTLDTATEQAIDWLVRLDSGHADEDDHHAFRHWLAQAEAHRHAWAAVQARLGGGVDSAIAQLRHAGPAATAARQALQAPVPSAARRRRMLRGGLAALLATTAAGWAAHRQTPLTTLAADLRTGTGQRLRHHLPDGSEITLDARSAADIAYGASQRLVRLRAGALTISVAPAGNGPPFAVQSAQGSVQALGTRFMVRQEEDGHTLAHVMEHSVRITTLGGTQHTLAEGESARFSARAITPLGTPRAAPAAWADGLIDVRDQPLADVIDALRPYLPGPVRVSPEAARLRVFGVFPLDRPQQVLQDLVDTHPIAVRRWGAWLTLVDVCGADS
jgi:transmembrane sensor